MTQRLPRGRPRRARHRARGRPLPGHRRSARSSATATRPSSSPSAPTKEKHLTKRRARPPQEGRRPAACATLVEFRDEAGELQVGETVTVEAFEVGQTRQDLRHLEGQGLPGHDQAPQLRQRPEVPRLAQRARPGLDRRLGLALARDEGHPRPRPDGQQARHPEGPDDRRARRRARTCCSSAARSPARATASWRCAPMPSAPILGGGDDRRRSTTTAFGARFNGPLVHESVRAELAARRQGTHVDQDARQGPRRRRQAVAPEGHRPRPRRLVALARSGPAAAPSSAPARATTPSRSTARSAAPRCAARCRSTPSAARSRSSTPPAFDDAVDQAGRRAARATGASQGSRAGRAGRRRGAGAALSLPQPRARVGAARRGRRRRRPHRRRRRCSSPRRRSTRSPRAPTASDAAEEASA